MSTLELFYDSQWNDIGPYLLHDPVVTINRGRADESSNLQPGSMSLQLHNDDGRFAARNPLSPLYGKVGRNTPIRWRKGASDVKLLVGAGHDVSTPDVAALDITGDIDIRMDLEPTDWRPVGLSMGLINKWDVDDVQSSWRFFLNQDGTLGIRWSTNGTLANSIRVDSTVAIPITTGRLAVAVTLDVNNGASGHSVRFFTGPSMATADLVQLGATVTASPVTSIFSGTSKLAVGRLSHNSTLSQLVGKVYAAQVRNGIDGTQVANPVFTTLPPGTKFFTDAAGRAWTVTNALVADESVRFQGEVSEWPQRWTPGSDVRVPVEAAGIIRRLGQGRKPLRSSLYRDLVNAPNIVAYWPMEDGRDATRLANAKGGQPMGFYGAGTLQLSAFDEFVASEPIPTWNTRAFRGTVDPYTPNAPHRILALVHVPAVGVAADRPLLHVFTTGSLRRFNLVTNANGDLKLDAFDADGNLYSSGNIGFAVEGKLFMMSILLTQDGGDVDWQIMVFEVGSSAGGFASGSFVVQTFGRVNRVGGGSANDLAGTAIGHLAVTQGDPNAIWSLIGRSLDAWSGETAAERIARLCLDEGIPLVQLGDALGTEAVGPQQPDQLLTLLDDVADVELGVLGETRYAAALEFRARSTLYNQPALELDYDARHIAPPLEPTDDDQQTRNVVTVTRRDGASFTAELTAGPMSTALPPDGVGLYDDDVTLNLATDDQLDNQAGWRLHLGTIDEARIPTLTLFLHSADLAALVDDVLAIDIGDRIRISNTPDWLPGPVDLIVQGYTETDNGVEHIIRCTCTPGSAWTVAVADTDRFDTEDSTTTASFVSGTNTLLSVATNRGPIWTTLVGEFPFEIEVSGVVLNVTAISGASSPQTFTVTQAPVNGIVKTIPAGSDVRLAQPAIMAL